MDKTLLTNYANAIRARPAIALLPTGPREHAQQYERLALDDIRIQMGNPNLTEQQILDMIKPTLADIVMQELPIIIDYALTAIKKHYPTATIASVLSAGISYLISTIQK